jgi:hypothetical protein
MMRIAATRRRGPAAEGRHPSGSFRRKCAECVAAAFLLGIAYAAASAEGIKDDARKAGRSVGSTAHDAWQGTKKAGKDVGHATKKAGHAVGDPAKEDAHEVKRAFKGEK